MKVINGKTYATAREFMKIYKAVYAKDSTIQLTLKEAKQTMTLDPNAVSYSDDQIIGKINNATATISRASSVTSAARPIGNGEVNTTQLADNAVQAAKIKAGEVSNAKLASTAAKDNLDALSDTARGYIKTAPTTGQFKIIEIQRQADGKLAVAYDDVAQ